MLCFSISLSASSFFPIRHKLTTNSFLHCTYFSASLYRPSRRTISTTTTMNAQQQQRQPAKCDIVLDDFTVRQFDIPSTSSSSSSYAGTKIPVSQHEFMGHVEKFYEKSKLVDGYAPFCKHVFMPNFDDRIVDPAVQITPQNEHLLRTMYEARTEDELPVLIRFFPEGTVKPVVAKYLDLILYSREQIEKENKAMDRDIPLEDAPWRLISIKAQGVPYEIPMTPITIMRNELISQGGSGVPIEKEAYMKSVAYWKDHAIIR